MATYGSYSSILTRDPETAVEEHYHWDEQTGQMRLEQRQHVRPILEAAKAKYAATDERARYGEKGRVVATIPIVLWHEMQKQGITRDQKALRRWLDDPDNRSFRVMPGSLSK